MKRNFDTLEVGSKYADGQGNIITITEYDSSDILGYPFLGGDWRWYTATGNFCADTEDLEDLLLKVDENLSLEVGDFYYNNDFNVVEITSTFRFKGERLYVGHVKDSSMLSAYVTYTKEGFSITSASALIAEVPKEEPKEEPKKELKLEVGKSYVNGYGDVFTIIRVMPGTSRYSYVAEPLEHSHNRFTERGFSIAWDDKFNLIKEVSPNHKLIKALNEHYAKHSALLDELHGLITDLENGYD